MGSVKERPVSIEGPSVVAIVAAVAVVVVAAVSLLFPFIRARLLSVVSGLYLPFS